MANTSAAHGHTRALGRRFLRGTCPSQTARNGEGSSRFQSSMDRITTAGTMCEPEVPDNLGRGFRPAQVNPYLFTAQQFDSSTGLYSLRARYYDPSVGRFLSQDTANYNLTSPPSLNRYVYAANDPINRTDPRGLQALTEYSQMNEAEGEESAALESYGEEFASSSESLVEDVESGFESTQTWDTTANARILRGNMRDGDVLGRIMEPGDQAHHLVPSTKTLAQPARDVLDAAKIDINSQSNGLWLKPEVHYTTYTNAYSEAVNRVLAFAESGGRDQVLAALREIARGILAGTFP